MLDADMTEATNDDLNDAAGQLGTVLIGEPVRSYFSLASRARRGEADYWLRVRRAHLLTWTADRLGYADSGIIEGVPKPVVLDSTQWQDASYVVRAELMTYVPDTALSLTVQLTKNPSLPFSWWTELHSAIDNLSRTETQRDTARVLNDMPYLRRFYGAHLQPPKDWATEHEDPHWANITGPRLHILDWDFWGRQPRGFTIAGLYCSSLTVPEVSSRIRREFDYLLDSPSGKWSILYHIWYRRKALSSFTAWSEAAEVAGKTLRDLT